MARKQITTEKLKFKSLGPRARARGMSGSLCPLTRF